MSHKFRVCYSYPGGKIYYQYKAFGIWFTCYSSFESIDCYELFNSLEQDSFMIKLEKIIGILFQKKKGKTVPGKDIFSPAFSKK